MKTAPILLFTVLLPLHSMAQQVAPATSPPAKPSPVAAKEKKMGDRSASVHLRADKDARPVAAPGKTSTKDEPIRIPEEPKPK